MLQRLKGMDAPDYSKNIIGRCIEDSELIDHF